ncbi:MAG: hypothetical protein J6Q94_06440 [Clostridia bacterium]|nr:hypothetical protein [Clostridia bacterium]
MLQNNGAFMNTYYNEITEKPVQSENGKIVYRIPYGAFCGNGDLGIVFNNDDDGLIIHISKCDFWKFTPGAHSEGGIKTVGTIRFNNIDLQKYNIRQYFDKGLMLCQFADTEMEVFVAPENKIYFQIKSPDNGSFPEIDIGMPETCGSKNFVFNDMGLKWYLRKFDGKDVIMESDVAVCCKRLETERHDGFKIVRYCIAVVTNFDTPEYVSRSIDMALHCDYDADKINTAEKWKKFFSASKVTLPDKTIEKHYNASLYLLACCMGNAKFPPGLFGNFITDDFFPWAGDYHLNYNYEAPYYCVFSSNHPELANGYMMPLEDMIEKGREYAKFENCKGIYFPVSFGPKGLDLYTMKGCKEHDILFLGQKSNAAYAAVIVAMHWYSTYDKDYARNHLYPYMREVADFWEDYLVKEKNRYVILKDAAHEIPYYRCEKFKYWTHKNQIEAKNNIVSVALVRMVMKCILDMSAELDIDSEKRAVWQDILDNISEFPTFIKRGKRCFRYTEKGMRWRNDNTVGLQHIFPISQIGLGSDKKLLKIARNSYFMNDRRLDDNGSNSYLPAGARIGVDPKYLIDGLRMNIKEFALPNMLFRHHGGGIEHLTTVPATINEMLMQSHEGIIRLFPCWDKNDDASFENLRADGAFLVSAEIKNGKIPAVKIRSLAGRKCTVDCGFVKNVIRVVDGKKIKFQKNDNVISFKTDVDTEYLLK